MSQQVATERRNGVEIRAGFVRLAGDLVRNRLLISSSCGSSNRDATDSGVE
jgi:hypothetical protein